MNPRFQLIILALFACLLGVYPRQIAAKDKPALPDITLTVVINGAKADYYELQGKVVALDFIDIAAADVDAEIHRLQALFDAYVERGLMVIAVTSAEQTAVEQYVQNKSITFPVGVGPAVIKDFNVRVFPRLIYIVDGTSRMQSTLERADLEKKLEQDLLDHPGDMTNWPALRNPIERFTQANVQTYGADPLGVWEGRRELVALLESGAFDAESANFIALTGAIERADKKCAELAAGEALLKKYTDLLNQALTITGRDPRNFKAMDHELKKEAALYLDEILRDVPDSMTGKQAKRVKTALLGE